MGPAGLRTGGVGAHPGLLLPPLLPLLPLLLLLLPPPAPGATCPTPSAIEHADIRVKSYHQSSRERYTCRLGFKRKAGTSSLIECVFNETTGTARWTRPTLRCIRDPSLAQHRPPSTSTVVPGVVTPKPQDSSPSRKDASLPSHPNGMGHPEPVTGPGSRLKPFGPPPAGPKGGVEQAPSPSPDVSTYTATYVAPVLSSVPVLLLCGLVLLCYRRARQRSQHQRAETENPEELPMTGAPHGTENPENLTPTLQ